ncbi:MAG TPA: class I SAM-dependent methyltransferase [Pseudonocardiaceae bacterium]
MTDIAGQDWEEQANNWIAWARKPNFDSYWRYRDEFFELVPPPGTATVDVGCGEGRVSRDLAAHGHNVTGVDAAPTMIAAAKAADPDGTYLRADAADLPFADGSFDIVVAYNTFMDVVDLPGSIGEAARVLAPGGRLCMAITHPVINTGTTVGTGADRKFVLDQPYFETRRFTSLVKKDGMEMLFQGWSHPLTGFTRPIEDAGLLIEAIREPKSLSADGTAYPYPFHFWLRALRPA